MLKAGPGKKVCIYVSEDQQHHGTSLYSAILDFLFYRGVSGATVTRGLAGFGADHHLHTARVLRLTENLPIKIEFIESAEKVNELFPKLSEMAGTGLIEMQDTMIAKPSGPSGKPAPQAPVLHFRLEGKAKLMRIYVGESDRWRDKPLHEAIIEALRVNDLAGATVYRGIMGYGANGRIHKDSMLKVSRDLPIMISVVDEEQKLRAFLPTLDDMIRTGALIVFSDVDIIKYVHGPATSTETGGEA